MDDRTRRVLRHQQAALLSALGAFDALAIVGADKHLPGYARCKKEVEDALAEAEEMFSHCGSPHVSSQHETQSA